MKLLLSLSLWIALILSSSGGESDTAGGDEKEEEEEELTTEYYDYPTVTGTPDYDYNATFDYYYVTGIYEVKDVKTEETDPPVHSEPARNQASVIGQLSLLLPLGLAVLQICH